MTEYEKALIETSRRLSEYDRMKPNFDEMVELLEWWTAQYDGLSITALEAARPVAVDKILAARALLKRLEGKSHD